MQVEPTRIGETRESTAMPTVLTPTSSPASILTPTAPTILNRLVWLMNRLLKIYHPVLDWALKHRPIVLSTATLLLAITMVLAFGLPRPISRILDSWHWQWAAKVARGMGSEFMPTLNEGSLLFMPVLLPSTSLTEIKRLISWQDEVMKQVPEVQSAAGKLGRSETATDPACGNNEHETIGHDPMPNIDQRGRE